MDPTDRAPRPPAITAHGLTKRFGTRVAVDRLSFSVPAGAVVGLVGPNGAGKTTLMGMLLGLTRVSAGRASVLGHDIADPGSYLGRVGALIEAPAFHPGLSGRDNLRYLARLRGGRARSGRSRPDDARELDALLVLVGLDGRGDDPYRTYSLGMKQRLGIAAALIGDPELVLLDEPSNGVDASGMREIRRIVADIAAAGRTVVVSSHLLAELEQVCDWLLVVDHGGLVHQGPLEEFGGGSGGALLVATEHPADLDTIGALAVCHGLDPRPDGGRLRLPVGDGDPTALAASINREAHRAGIALVELHHRRPDLNERYLALVDAGGDR